MTLKGEANVIISRPDTLDSISEPTFQKVEENTNLFFFNEGAESPDDDVEVIGVGPGSIEEIQQCEEAPDEPMTVDTQHLSSEEVSGLHAKLFLFERAGRVSLYTGSANATNNALRGRNVEFMVKLIGDRKRVGIERLLGDEKEIGTLRELLLEYTRENPPEEEDHDKKLLEDDLEKARTSIVKARLSLVVSPDSKGTFLLSLQSEEPISLGRGKISGACYPITMRKDDAELDILPLLEGLAIEFASVPLASVSSFIAFELSGRRKRQAQTIGFVLNVPVEGIPGNRDSEIMRSVISNREKFIRYLLFLLADDSKAEGIGEILREITGGPSARSTHSGFTMPLLEELLRAFSRRPDRIKTIDKRLRELQSAERLEEVIPEEFDVVWCTFREAIGKGVASE